MNEEWCFSCTAWNRKILHVSRHFLWPHSFGSPTSGNWNGRSWTSLCCCSTWCVFQTICSTTFYFYFLIVLYCIVLYCILLFFPQIFSTNFREVTCLNLHIISRKPASELNAYIILRNTCFYCFCCLIDCFLTLCFHPDVFVSIKAFHISFFLVDMFSFSFFFFQLFLKSYLLDRRGQFPMTNGHSTNLRAEFGSPSLFHKKVLCFPSFFYSPLIAP